MACLLGTQVSRDIAALEREQESYRDDADWSATEVIAVAAKK